MTLARRLLTTLTLLAAMTVGAQEAATTATTEVTTTAAEATSTTTDEETTATTTTTTASEEREERPELPSNLSYEVRNTFSNIVRRTPGNVGTVLALDPTLLANDHYIANFPELYAYVKSHPEIPRNPRFFLAEFQAPRNNSVLDELLEVVAVGSTFAFIAVALAWIVRQIIEQKRWSRLARTQNDVHNKILDRFGTSQELLEYVRTPAGTRFLESAPIPLHEPKPQANRPLHRIMWSVQLGVILAATAIGMLLVSAALDGESSDAMLAMGLIALFVGVGFIGSALASLYMSKRFGLWKPDASIDGPGA